MPTYTFTGKNMKGAKVTGERTADSKVALTQLLRKEQIIPQVIKEKVKEAAGKAEELGRRYGVTSSIDRLTKALASMPA